MSDITDKLRAIYPKYHNLNEWDVRYEAADTIEALRAENARLMEEVALQMEHKETFRVENARLREEVSKERERCAKIADKFVDCSGTFVAAAIRDIERANYLLGISDE